MEGAAGIDSRTRARIDALMDEGQAIWDGFDTHVRGGAFHPFVPANYEQVLRMLLEHRRPGQTFLEWGSATGVITIMADLLGYEAYGIELDGDLVGTARELAARYESGAVFAHGSFLPAGYVFRRADGDTRLGTIGDGPSGYLELGRPLEDFDVVFGYPWGGEAPMMRDLMKRYGSKRGVLLIPAGADS